MNTLLFLVVTVCYADGLDCQKWVPETYSVQAAQACNNTGMAHYNKSFPDGQDWSFECITEEQPPEMTGDYEADESEVAVIGYEDGTGWME